MKAKLNVRVIGLALIVAIVLGYGAATVLAGKPENDGTLLITPVEEIIGEFYTVEVNDDGVFAVLNSGERDEVRLLVEGGKGLVNNGTIADGDDVFVTSRDKKHKHRGHVTILK